MSDLPEPLTPPACDLRDFPFIPLHIARLKQSRAWLLCKRKPFLAFQLFNLWTAAWHAVPAGSLENDDMVLADIAMCDDDTWAAVKADALRGWVACEDGRLYHPIVCEQALEGWIQKLTQRKATAAASAKRTNVAFDAEPYDQALAEALGRLRTLNPNARTLARRPVGEVASPTVAAVSPPSGPPGSPPGSPDEHRPDDPPAHQEKGQGQGEGREPPSGKPSGGDARARDPAADGADGFDDRVVPIRPAKPGGSKRPPKADGLWPDDLAMTEADRRYAEDRGYHGDAADRLWEQFENRAKAKGWRYVDWHAGWRTFVGKAVEFAARDAATARSPPLNGSAPHRATRGVQSAMAGIDSYFGAKRQD